MHVLNTQMMTASSELESDDSDIEYIPTSLRISASLRVPARFSGHQVDFQSINSCVILAKCCFLIFNNFSTLLTKSIGDVENLDAKESSFLRMLTLMDWEVLQTSPTDATNV